MLLLNEQRFNGSVQYGKHLLGLFPLPDNITYTLSYLTASHLLPSLSNLSFLLLFLPSTSISTFEHHTLPSDQTPLPHLINSKKALLHPLPSCPIFHFSSSFLSLCVIHFDSFERPMCQSAIRALPSQQATVKHGHCPFEGVAEDSD